MKSYRVVIVETNRYAVDVIAKNDAEAETKAFMHRDFVNSIPVETDSVVEEILENEY